MKRGTKALFALLAAALVFGFAPPARAAGEVTGYALYTDIVAQVDGHSIPSYNVGGAYCRAGEGFGPIWTLCLLE